MRTTRVVSISMSPELARETERLAHEENRTISELIRQALRAYREERRWQRTLAYGRARAKALGLKERDVVPIVRGVRHQDPSRRSAK